MKDSEIMKAVTEKVLFLMKKYNATTENKLDNPEIHFILKPSRTAGTCLYNIEKRQCKLSFNMPFLRDNFEYMMNSTVPHEVCHYLAEFNSNKTVGHGRLWKLFMRHYGYEPNRCHNMTLPESIRRTSFTYACSCMEHNLTKIRHNKILKGTKYYCVHCNSELSFVKEEKK